MNAFHLNKWYLDFVDKQGRAMIFYAAQLTWYGVTIKYGSWLDSTPGFPVRVKQGFNGIRMPSRDGAIITFSQKRYGVSGIWKSKLNDDGLQTRIIDMSQGHLDWNCYQPASEIILNLDGKELKGKGYAEQLILTIPPWKIPMKYLRWGRFASDEYNVVWIQIDLMENEKWLWLNGERQCDVEINDDQISIPGKGILLTLDKYHVLETEKKINSVVEKLIKYVPGIKRAMPTQFLMADEYKWLSHGEIRGPGFASDGMAIHEYVNFQPI